MQHEQLIRTATLSLALLLPLTVGCVAEWHEDGDGWWHDDPSEVCDAGERWDPVDCVCEPDPNANNNTGGTNNNNTGGTNNNNNGGTNNNNTGGGVQCPDPMGALYLSRDSSSCAAVQFTCPEGYDQFIIEGCGCGCDEVQALDPCPDATAEGVLFVSTDARVCGKVPFQCAEGDTQFYAECGCGCITPPPAPTCPDAADGRVHYLNTDPAVCDAISFSCDNGCVEFDNECGCGCIEP